MLLLVMFSNQRLYSNERGARCELVLGRGRQGYWKIRIQVDRLSYRLGDPRSSTLDRLHAIDSSILTVKLAATD